jgi:hypothetical protein
MVYLPDAVFEIGKRLVEENQKIDKNYKTQLQETEYLEEKTKRTISIDPRVNPHTIASYVVDPLLAVVGLWNGKFKFGTKRSPGRKGTVALPFTNSEIEQFSRVKLWFDKRGIKIPILDDMTTKYTREILVQIFHNALKNPEEDSASRKEGLSDEELSAMLQYRQIATVQEHPVFEDETPNTKTKTRTKRSS